MREHLDRILEGLPCGVLVVDDTERFRAPIPRPGSFCNEPRHFPRCPRNPPRQCTATSGSCAIQAAEQEDVFPIVTEGALARRAACRRGASASKLDLYPARCERGQRAWYSSGNASNGSGRWPRCRPSWPMKSATRWPAWSCLRDCWPRPGSPENASRGWSTCRPGCELWRRPSITCCISTACPPGTRAHRSRRAARLGCQFSGSDGAPGAGESVPAQPSPRSAVGRRSPSSGAGSAEPGAQCAARHAGRRLGRDVGQPVRWETEVEAERVTLRERHRAGNSVRRRRDFRTRIQHTPRQSGAGACGVPQDRGAARRRDRSHSRPGAGASFTLPYPNCGARRSDDRRRKSRTESEGGSDESSTGGR